jgi:hypothetical protein
METDHKGAEHKPGEHKPVPPRRPPARADLDDDAPAQAAPRHKPGLLPTGLSRAIVIGAVFLGLCAVVPLLFANRYVLVPAPRSDNALVFRLDTLTGRMHLCSAAQCNPVAEKDSGG